MNIPKLSLLEETFALQLRALKMQGWQREVVFAPPRCFRADFLHADLMIIVEINGGTMGKGAHSTPKGIQRDYDKANQATALGYRYFQFTAQDVRSGRAIQFIEFVVQAKRKAA